MGRIEEEWAALPVIARVALCKSVSTGDPTDGRYGAAKWEDVPERMQKELTALLIPDTDPHDRAEHAGWSQGKPVFRASMAGHCIKELYLWRVGAAKEFEQVERDPYRDKGELGAQEGSLHEAWIIDYLKAEGYDIESTGDVQEALELRYKRFVVRSHPDGLIRGLEIGQQWRVLECKALNEDRYDLWVSQGWSAFPNYAHQMSLEMFLASKKYDQPILGFFVVKNRNTGEMVRTLVDRYPVDPATIINKFSTIENLVEQGGMPPCDDNAEWFWCPFLGGNHCDAVKKKDGSNVSEIIDANFGKTLRRFAEVKATIKAAESEKDAIRALIIEKMVEPILKVKESEDDPQPRLVKWGDRSRTGFAIVKAKEFIDANGGNSSDFNTTSAYKELRVSGGPKDDSDSGFED